MSNEKKNTAAFLDFIQQHQMTMREEIANIYRLHVLENRYVLHPRKLDEIAIDDIKQFIGFLNSEDEELALDHGRSRAKIGLSHRALLKMGTYLRSFCSRYTGNQIDEEINTLFIAMDTFLNGSISGYIENMEIILLDDQEKIKRALIKAQQSGKTQNPEQTAAKT